MQTPHEVPVIQDITIMAKSQQSLYPHIGEAAHWDAPVPVIPMSASERQSMIIRLKKPFMI